MTRSQKPKRLKRASDGTFKLDGKIWIPHDAKDLQLRVFVVSHSGIGSHRGTDATESVV